MFGVHKRAWFIGARRRVGPGWGWKESGQKAGLGWGFGGHLMTADHELGGDERRSRPEDVLPYARVHLHGPARPQPCHQRANLPSCSRIASAGQQAV
jgi:hypothetical protein